MNIWRLIAHHKKPDEAIELMIEKSRIAIGWSDIGDMTKLSPKNQSEITRAIKKAYPHLNNAHLGGPSLWNLFRKMRKGDLVTLNAKSRKICVFEITGEYFFEDGDCKIFGNSHQRQASLTSIDPKDLWQSSGASFLNGENQRWTLAACFLSEKSRDSIYEEGARFSVTSTAIERNPKARKDCLSHFGYQCIVCGCDFKKQYGEIGEEFIHVHHRIDISCKPCIHNVDPIKDLIPICPNCHAMAHKRKPAIPIEELKEIYSTHNNARRKEKVLV